VSVINGAHVFTTPDSTVTTLQFAVRNEGVKALTRGFGLQSGGGTLELFDYKGNAIGAPISLPSGFYGILLDTGTIASVRITSNGPLDNFAYAEPIQDIDGDGVAYGDPDIDGDGIPNAQDPDRDGDGVPNSQDAFPDDTMESVDTDHDGIGDNFDPDDDNDGVPDSVEARRGTNPKKADTDGDGIPDGLDNCPLVPNRAQTDTNRDGRGDACSDMVPPVLTKLALRPGKFRKGPTGSTMVSFRLSEDSTVELRVLRVAGSKRRPVSGVIVRQANAGLNFARFDGRIGGRELRAGRYVLVATATDLAGNRARQSPRARFTILR
jgi:hypothetical protein